MRSLTFFLLLTLICCVPKKDNPATKHVLVFQDFDNQQHIPDTKDSVYYRIGEKNLFDEFLNELILSHNQERLIMGDAFDIRTARIIFKDWSSIELDKNYEIEDLKYEFEYISPVEKWKLTEPAGTIRLTSKTADSLTFFFNLSIYEKERNNLLLYKGERVFKKTNNYWLRKKLLEQHSRVIR